MSQPAPKDMDFKQLKDELDQLSVKLDDELNVDIALEMFERGTALIEELNKRIDEAEQKITKVKSK